MANVIVKSLVPTLTQLVPASELAPGEISSIRNNFIRKLVQIASSELKINLDRIVVRDIRPKDDLDYTYQTWSEITGATNNAYEVMSTGTGSNTPDRWVGFFGVKVNNNPPVSLIKFNIGGGDRAIWSLENLKPEDDMTGFSPAGVVIPPSQPWAISRYVIAITSAANVILKGVVVEARGRNISP